MSKEPAFLVWSNEHGGWWGPGHHGYSLDYRTAGRYRHEEAAEIVKRAGYGGPRAMTGVLVAPEVLVLAPEHRWQGGPPEPQDRLAETAIAVAEAAVAAAVGILRDRHSWAEWCADRGEQRIDIRQPTDAADFLESYAKLAVRAAFADLTDAGHQA